MRGFLAGIFFTVLVAVSAGVYGIKSGKLSLAADAEPSTLESRVADLALDQYVEQNAPKQQNPKAVNSATLIAGARAYEENCAECHGGAARRINPMAKSFSPPIPQFLNHHVMGGPDGELFFVIKHGIRWTAMPAWDHALSDDQIWTVVAFLKTMNNPPPEVQAAWQQAATKSADAGVSIQQDSAPQPPPGH